MDLSYEMTLVHKKKIDNAKCIVGNAENPPFQLSTFDTLLSSLTLHWCNIDSNLFKNFQIYLSLMVYSYSQLLDQIHSKNLKNVLLIFMEN